MKKLLLTLLTLTFASLAHAQGGNTVTIRFTGAPSGSCSPVSYAVNNATGEFYDCLAGAWNLVTGGGGGSGTVGANNIAAGAVANYASAGGSTAVGATTLNYVAPVLTVGATADTGSGQIALAGDTSGTATITAPAVAGTSNNPIVFSNRLEIPATGCGQVAIGVSSAPTSGFTISGASIFFTSAGVCKFKTGLAISSGSSDAVFGFQNNTNAASGTVDVGISRGGAAGLLKVGNGTANDASGTIQAAAYQTATNCSAAGTAANPSVVSCSGASSGAFSCDVAASGTTCVVNTTAVTANSNIQITSTASANARLSVTCNTAPTFGAVPTVSAISAGTSFTINMPTIVTNPACFFYTIVN